MLYKNISNSKIVVIFYSVVTLISLLIGTSINIAVAQEASSLSQAQEIIAICTEDRNHMNKALDFLKKEVTFSTGLPINEDKDWLPKALINEKLSLSYDNLIAARNTIDSDCKTMDYITSLLSKLQEGKISGEDSQLLSKTERQVTISLNNWKKEYIIFWHVLAETIHQYQENTKLAIPSSPAQ